MIYNAGVARGWESKSVEEQISAAEAKQARAQRALTAEEIERRRRIASLELERARIKRQIEAARQQPYREMLERALAHLEAELAALQTAASDLL